METINIGADVAAKIGVIYLFGSVVGAILMFSQFRLEASIGVCLISLLSIVSYLLFVNRREASREARTLDGPRYQALAEAVGELVMDHAADGRVLSVRGDTRRLFDLDPSVLRGSGLRDRVHVSDRDAFVRALDSALRDNVAASARFRFRTGDARETGANPEEGFAWAETRFRRLPIEAHGRADAAAVVSVTRAATPAERRPGKAGADAIVAISLKDRLLANVSHELRTPLNAILGFSEILANPELAPCEAPKRIEYARIIHSSAEHLLSVVNLVLDMSKIEAGKFEIVPESFDIAALIDNCSDMLRLKAEGGKVALTKRPMTGPLEIIADQRACRQILLNLMSNAVKFTLPGGSVEVGVRLGEGSVHIFVGDTGIGIAPEDLPRLGSPFFQVRSGYDRGFEGAGLGLSLVKGLVGLHGGSVVLESAAGIGTRVTVELPLDCRMAPRAGAGATPLVTAELSAIPAAKSPPAGAGSVMERKIA